MSGSTVRCNAFFNIVKACWWWFFCFTAEPNNSSVIPSAAGFFLVFCTSKSKTYTQTRWVLEILKVHPFLLIPSLAWFKAIASYLCVGGDAAHVVRYIYMVYLVSKRV